MLFAVFVAFVLGALVAGPTCARCERERDDLDEDDEHIDCRNCGQEIE